MRHKAYEVDYISRKLYSANYGDIPFKEYIIDGFQAIVSMFMLKRTGFTDANDCQAYFLQEHDVRNNASLALIFISSALLPLDNYNFWKEKQKYEKARLL